MIEILDKKDYRQRGREREAERETWRERVMMRVGEI